MTRSNPSSDSVTPIATQWRNLLIVLVAIALSVAIVLGLRTQTNGASLESLAAKSVPLEIAQTNGKPTLVEFYANWCTACQSMAGDVAKLEQQYGQDVNFVMLNVDNTKWLPEILKYSVEGIPHFVYFNKTSEAIAMAVGQQPYPLMSENLLALSNDQALPYQQVGGRTSAFSAPVKPNPAKPNSDDPRGHGGQPASVAPAQAG
jgi:thiol-disulfide isomerase/thioredoxin